MDNHEDFLDALTAYARSPSPEIPPVLDQYLTGVAKNGETLFQWPLLKPLIVGKIEQVIQELRQGLEAENIPTRPNVENVRFEVMHARIMDAVHKFTGAPFTIQRLCELLMDPKRHYKRSDKFMRGLEKNVLVVSTVDPFGRKVVSESSSKPLVNGMDSSSSPFLPRDPHSSTPLPPVPDWVTSPIASRSHTASGADSQDTTQESSVTTNGVGNLVSSVYTDHGEQPMAVHAEEVIEETVVTMDTNEVAAVTTDGGEEMAEEEGEEMGGEDTNASSSSSSSSSSEELSISDSSDSSTPSAPAASVSSSTEPREDRPWACLNSQGDGTLDPQAPPDQATASTTTTSSTTAQSEEVDWAETGPTETPPSNPTIPTEDSETAPTDMSSSLAWHPLTTASTSTTATTSTAASSSSSPPSDSITSSEPSTSPTEDINTTQESADPGDSFGFDTVTTSAASTETSAATPAVSDSCAEPSKSHVQLEDSGGVNDISDPSTTPAQVVETTASQSSVLSTLTSPEVGQELVASSSSSSSLESSTTFLSPRALASTYPECDSVAGLERLVSSVDAASPITVLSSSSSPPHHPLTQSDGVEDSTDEPEAKRSRMSEVEEDVIPGEDEEEEEEESSVQEAISSSTSHELMDQSEGVEPTPAESTPSSQPEGPQVVKECNVSSSDTSSAEEAPQSDSMPGESEEEIVSESCELGVGDKGKQSNNAVGSPPSHLSSSSSSDSEGFDVSAGDGKSVDKEDTESTAPLESEEEGGTTVPMDQD